MFYLYWECRERQETWGERAFSTFELNHELIIKIVASQFSFWLTNRFTDWMFQRETWSSVPFCNLSCSILFPSTHKYFTFFSPRLTGPCSMPHLQHALCFWYPLMILVQDLCLDTEMKEPLLLWLPYHSINCLNCIAMQCSAVQGE